MPYYVELSTPTHNYSSILSWQNSNLISYRLFNNEDLISNGSGLFQYGPSSGFSVNLTEIYPKHMGQMDIGCDGNLSIHARECLGGEWRIRLERLPDWRDVRLDVKVIQTFLFFKEDFHFHLHYALHPRSFNLNWTKDDRSIVRCAFAHGDAHLNHLLQINTSLIEFDYHTRVIGLTEFFLSMHLSLSVGLLCRSCQRQLSIFCSSEWVVLLADQLECKQL